MKSSFADFYLEANSAPVKNLIELVEYNKEHWADSLQKGMQHSAHN